MQLVPDALRLRLAPIRSVAVITGAGVSAESGIRTYRGKGGVYDDPAEGDRTIDALTGSTLERDPDRTWRTLALLARESRGAAPNPAHHAIAELERRVERFVLLTQNVDGLHQAAGSKNIIDIHGTLFDTKCMGCAARGHLEQIAELDAAPRCPACGGVLRPDVVLFGELLPEGKLRRLHSELYAQIPELVLVAGTTALFPYIADPVVIACRARRLTVEVNPEPTELSDIVNFSIRAQAGEALPELVAAVGSEAR